MSIVIRGVTRTTSEKEDTLGQVRKGAWRRSAGLSEADGDVAGLEVRDEPHPADETIADRDQTVSDRDQTASDSDQSGSERDQAQAEADQDTSDRDQAAADRDRAGRVSVVGPDGDYEASRAARLAGTLERMDTGRARAQTASDRLLQTTSRDEHARLRDMSADARDAAARERDLAAAEFERQSDLRTSGHAARDDAAAVRERAATDRARAAADRERAAADRASSARDRERANSALMHAHIDQLTGAYGRHMGTVALERELNRARHANGRLVLAYVDVDDLKKVNDHQGHPAGDALLQAVVHAIQQHLRSYDPIVRFGGDEFVVALADCHRDDACRRFRQISATLKQTPSAASISVGFAQLDPADTLDQLIARADSSLLEQKRTKRSRGEPDVAVQSRFLPTAAP